ncbi:MAG: PrsW family intramembrane metalloprotease [Kiritimatiellae bacterium]|nr:PrsW family intramembrane metalloprotease [Kiritimatiellia bacterium]
MRYLRALSYSRSGLMRSCAVILLAGVLGAAISSWMFRADRERIWETDRSMPRDDRERLYEHWFWDLETLLSGLEVLPEETADSFQAFGRRVLAGDHEALAELKQRAGVDSVPDEGVLFLLGLHHMRMGEYEEAAAAARRENELYPHGIVRHLAVDALFRGGRFRELAALSEDPEYTGALRGGKMVRIAFRLGDLPLMFRHLLIAEYEGLRVSLLILALLTGGIWAAILLHVYPRGGLRPIRFWVPAALAMGWMSTWPTVMSMIWMEERFGFVEPSGNDFFEALLFHTLSVGIREELFKLLLFSPLLIVIRRDRQRGELDALMLGAMTGLGFAVEENLGYFAGTLAGGISTSRFVSATLLHAMLTGTAGLALYRAVRDPGKWLADSITVLAMVIGLHGLYNALLSAPIPGLGDMSYFYGAALAGAVHLFFREVRVQGGMNARTVSITGLFFWGYCVLICLEMAYTTLYFPFLESVSMVGETALAGVLTAFVFLHALREPIGD